ncbi:outer membrane beta-barrel family protein [Taibaiella sp. KBW10]|uniref:outer membrane beta-barrel family protein n=1 Tax=Taibaiella sp. KBW10 TaxID=2153357 RepID=UPI0013159F13|nr:outer membrane beta-barrel family protein [Taibaiella sp. KBW10]
MKTLPLLITVAGSLSLNIAQAQTGTQIPVPVVAASSVNSVNVSGSVVDGGSKQPVEMANVVLTGADKKQYYAYTDEAGKFLIEGVPNGSYKLSAYFVNYKNFEKDVVIDAATHDLGSIGMQSAATNLKEVTVTDFKKVIEQRPDGINYNVENDKSNLGTSATDVLRKVPMVTVDMEGNVQLRGNSNIKVLVDGKPSELMASSVKDVLRQIPADNIKSIEVLTSPGAKYDGEGASGVINIITKRKLIKGLSGTVFGAPSYNIDRDLLMGHVGANINYRQGKWGVNTSFGVSRWAMVLDSKGGRTDLPGTANETRLEQSQHMYGYGNFGWSKLGADYQIDSLQSIQASVNYNPGTWNQEMRTSAAYPKTGLNFSRNIDQKNPRNTVGANAAYSKKFKSNPKRTLDVLAAYSTETMNAGYNLSNENLNSHVVDYKEINDNRAQNKELTVQADYVEPLKGKNQKLEFGLKAINRDISSDYSLKSLATGQSDYVVDPSRSNLLTYNQLVGAAYGQFTTPLAKSLSMVAGARYEVTHINGNIRDNGGDFELPVFNNFLPNLVFMFDLKNFNKLKLSYNKRIERPSIEFVNPYIDYSDPLNWKQGNARLVPEKTHNFELGYSTFVGRSSINLSAFHRRTDNAIESSTLVNPATGISLTSYGNIAKTNATGADFFASSTFFGKLMVNVNASAYYKQLKSTSLNISNKGWEFKGNAYANYMINQKFSLNGFGMLNGNQVQLQGNQGGWYYYFIGAQMNILKGKGSIGIAAENFLTAKIDIPTKYTYQNATYDMTTTYVGRGVRMSFNYNFGKMQYGKEKAVNNDDLKKANSGQMGGAGGGN